MPEDAVLTPRPSWVTAWEGLSADERRFYAQMMEVYAGFLTHTDAQIGRVLDVLSALGVCDDTLIMLVSDNGASAGGGPQGWLEWPLTRDVQSMLSRLDDFGGRRALNHYAWGWAWAGNTPFRLWKRYSWPGGVRAPLVVDWPADIPAGTGGQVRSQFAHAIDVMPSILEAAGVDFETAGSRAIYHDGWKAVTDHVSDFGRDRELMEGSHDFDTDRWLVFRLDDDFSEANDVAATHPERMRQLVELWWSEAGRSRVLPLLHDSDHAAAIGPPAVCNRYLYLSGGVATVTPWPFIGFRLTAEIEGPDGRHASGVICAHQSCLPNYRMPLSGGWASYVRDQRLIAIFDTGAAQDRIVGEQVPLIGRHEIGISCVPDEKGDLAVVLTVDEQVVRAGRVSLADHPELLRIRGLLGGNLFIGHDPGVVPGDQRPQPFRGRIHRAVYEAAPTHHDPDIETALRNE